MDSATSFLDNSPTVSLVTEIEGKIQTIIDTNEACESRKLIIYKTISEELSGILDPRKSASIQGKRESIVMFIGLQGCEKSYTCADMLVTT